MWLALHLTQERSVFRLAVVRMAVFNVIYFPVSPRPKVYRFAARQPDRAAHAELGRMKICVNCSTAVHGVGRK
jgi:hypothetical protein